MPKRVLLVPDVPGWAWWRRACGIASGAPREYFVDVKPQAKTHGEDFLNYDAVLVFDWYAPLKPPQLPNTILWTFAASEAPIHGYPAAGGSARAQMASRYKNRETAKVAYRNFDGIININPWITSKLRAMTETPVEFLHTGVDTTLFYPTSNPREHGGKLRVGWCGKLPSKRWTPKGYREVLRPLVQRTADFIDWHIIESHPPGLDGNEMREFYNTIDVFLCTSCTEGTPSTVLEAAACGRRSFTTRVGICPRLEDEGIVDIVGWWDNGDQAAECVAEFERRLKWVAMSDTYWKRMTVDQIRSRIERNWSWNTRAPEWLERLTTRPSR